MEEAGLDEDGLEIVGAVHLEACFLKRSLKKAGRVNHTRLRNRLGIPEEDRIVLFTPHSFRKGSRGGLIGGHLTRLEAEEMLQAVLQSLEYVNDVALIIKLHHGDQNISFYQKAVETVGMSRKTAIRQHESIYELIEVSDILVSPVSTAILEAMLLHLPVLLIDFGKKRQVFPYAEWGAVQAAFRYEDFDRLLKNMLRDLHQSFTLAAEGRRLILEEFFNGFNGSSEFRIRSLIKRMSDRSPLRVRPFGKDCVENKIQIKEKDTESNVLFP